MRKNSNKHKQKSLILSPEIKDGKNIKTPTLVEIEELDHPVFCFKHLHKDYSISKCSDEQKAALLNKIEKWCSMSWDEIWRAPRHGLGCEKINIKSIKPKIPPYITRDVEYLLALRFEGMKPILVHRHKFLMHIIFIDRDFSVYDHE